MKRTRINEIPYKLPKEIQSLVNGAEIYDSSCSPEAKVYFLDTSTGFYLKRAKKESLRQEALMTQYFHKKGLGAEVISYISDSCDWLLTSRVNGEDATHKVFLDNPEKLCDFLAKTLRELHETDFSDCPVQNRNQSYVALAEKNYSENICDLSLTDKLYKFKSAKHAYEVFSDGKAALKNEVLLHGDYCLPNVMLNSDFTLSGFIDVGNGGVGDRHIDIFWGRWTLLFNLRTDRYAERFFDAYGRDKINKEILKTVAAAEVFG